MSLSNYKSKAKAFGIKNFSKMRLAQLKNMIDPIYDKNISIDQTVLKDQFEPFQGGFINHQKTLSINNILNKEGYIKMADGYKEISFASIKLMDDQNKIYFVIYDKSDEFSLNLPFEVILEEKLYNYLINLINNLECKFTILYRGTPLEYGSFYSVLLCEIESLDRLITIASIETGTDDFIDENNNIYNREYLDD